MIGFIFSIISGFTAPLFGYLVIKTLFGMGVPEEGLTIKETIQKYVIAMVILAATLCVATIISKAAFIYVAENIVISIRSSLYKSIIKKHMGWHD